jgi:hypothetical protein
MTRIRAWLQNQPHLLERIYQVSFWLFKWLKPVIARLGYKRADHWLRGPEHWAKQAIFGCKMCGQCVLHSTGMTCPMTCPKNLRNGPCGGVRPNGHCEVIPEMRCIWVEAYERSRHMPVFGEEILYIQPPVNRRLEGSSAWINMLTAEDKNVPQGWAGMSYIPLILKQPKGTAQ